MPLQTSREASRKREKDERGEGSKNIRSFQKTRKSLEPKGVSEPLSQEPDRTGTHLKATCRATRSNPHLKRIRLVSSWISESKFGSKELKSLCSP